eukprot:scaffold34_cov271-Prasinococcus_capsulatus_cf.AAC.8
MSSSSLGRRASVGIVRTMVWLAAPTSSSALAEPSNICPRRPQSPTTTVLNSLTVESRGGQEPIGSLSSSSWWWPLGSTAITTSSSNAVAKQPPTMYTARLGSTHVSPSHGSQLRHPDRVARCRARKLATSASSSSKRRLFPSIWSAEGTRSTAAATPSRRQTPYTRHRLPTPSHERGGRGGGAGSRPAHNAVPRRPRRAARSCTQATSAPARAHVAAPA